MQPSHRSALGSLKSLEHVVLALIAVATAVAVGQEVMVMVGQRAVHLADLLLLFIYLEVMTMVSIYIQSGQMPVRMPIYIAIVALARYLVLDMKAMEFMELIGVTLGILLLATAVLVIRYGHVRFPYESWRADEPAENGGLAEQERKDRTV